MGKDAFFMYRNVHGWEILTRLTRLSRDITHNPKLAEDQINLPPYLVNTNPLSLLLQLPVAKAR